MPASVPERLCERIRWQCVSKIDSGAVVDYAVRFQQRGFAGTMVNCGGYEWKNRVKNPKSCPKCKTRLDVETKENDKS